MTLLAFMTYSNVNGSSFMNITSVEFTKYMNSNNNSMMFLFFRKLLSPFFRVQAVGKGGGASPRVV